MPSTESAKTGIRYGYSDGETGWGGELNETLRRVDVELIPQWAQKRSTTTGLTFGYYGGIVPSSSGITQIADGTIAMTASSTNYVEHDAAGTVSSNTSGFTAGRWPMAEVVTNAGAIISVTDRRLLVGTPAGAGSGWALSGNPAKIRNALGAFDIQFRNNADSATNLGITDAGAVSVRASLAVGTDPGGSAVLRVGGGYYTRHVGAGFNIAEGYAGQVNTLHRRANGVVGAPTMVLNAQVLGEVSFQGYVASSAAFEYGADILALTEEDFDTTGQCGTQLQFFLAPVGGALAARWAMRAAGQLEPVVNNVSDIGSATNKLRTLYAQTSIILGAASPVTLDLNGSNNLRVNNSIDLSGATPFVGASTNTSLTFRTNNTARWTIEADGDLVAATDASFDIGPGLLRPRDLFVSRRILAGTSLSANNGIEANITAVGVSASFGVADGVRNPRLLVNITSVGAPSQLELTATSSSGAVNFYILNATPGNIAINLNGTTRWFFDVNGHLFSATEAENIGATGSGRPNAIFVKTLIDLYGATAIRLSNVDFVAVDGTFVIVKGKTGVDALKMSSTDNFYQNNIHTWRTAAAADRAKLDLSSSTLSAFSVGDSAWDGNVSLTLETISNGSNRSATARIKSRGAPYLYFYALNQGANQGQWALKAAGTALEIWPITDAGTDGSAAALRITRGAGAVGDQIIPLLDIVPPLAATVSVGTPTLPFSNVSASTVRGGVAGTNSGFMPVENTLSVANGGSTGTSNIRPPYTRLTLTGVAGTVTIDAPGNNGSPLYLSLIINNTASGTMNLTWNAVFQTGSLPATIASGAILHLLFLYSDVLNRWVKVA